MGNHSIEPNSNLHAASFRQLVISFLLSYKTVHGRKRVIRLKRLRIISAEPLTIQKGGAQTKSPPRALAANKPATVSTATFNKLQHHKGNPYSLFIQTQCLFKQIFSFHEPRHRLALEGYGAAVPASQPEPKTKFAKTRTPLRQTGHSYASPTHPVRLQVAQIASPRAMSQSQWQASLP